MARDEELKQRWQQVVDKLSAQFADGEVLDLDAIIYLIGVQELGKPHNKYKKDHKIDLMHIAICRLLEFFDDDGWPHYKVLDQLPNLKAGEQSVLMKEAIVTYFLEKAYIS